MDIGDYLKNKKEVKKCIQCGMLIPSNSPRYKARKFCSRKCNRRYFSLKRYYKIKNDKNYKNYRKEYYRGWIDKNRDKFNDYMREYMREVAPKYKKKKMMMNKIKRYDNKPIIMKPIIFNKASVFKNTIEVGRGIHDTIPVRE